MSSDSITTQVAQATRTTATFDAVGLVGDSAAERRMALDLLDGLESGQVSVVYQPIVRIATGEVVATEALARWNHPQRGIVPPDVFIRAAENTGAINAVGEHVLALALAQQRRWMDALGVRAPQIVCVNVSAHQVTDPGFVGKVARALTASGVPASRLALEITETAPLTDLNAAAVVIADLAALGATVELDDFGAGYATAAYLACLPVQVIKIDRVLIQRVPNEARAAAIVEALLGLCRGIGLSVIAEGCDNQVTQDWLSERGCDMAQGFYLARPLPAEDVTALLAALPAT